MAAKCESTYFQIIQNQLLNDRSSGALMNYQYKELPHA